MNDIEKYEQLKRGKAILEGKNEEMRKDGYVNMLNKYGTVQDNSTHYEFNNDANASDVEITKLYEGNGLFTKIIDRPAEECMKHGLDLDDLGDKKEVVISKLETLDIDEMIIKAEKWARLYGGAIAVMLIDDGGGLEDPLNWKKVRSIDEIRVYERAVVQPDYSGLYTYYNQDRGIPYGQPEFYTVFSQYGTFVVHYTRCLIFKNGDLPEYTQSPMYRFWGIPEYVKIKDALRQVVTTHENGPKLLERSVQAIYKMKNLSNLLATDDGEDKIVQRLSVIDMARGILNSVAIDGDGEDYTYINGQMSGVKDIIDSTCNMLSAVTDIPQTVLFGRSPAGESATGKSDLENYYNMVERIQTNNLKKNIKTLINLILIELKKKGEINDDIPDYEVRFIPLWNMSETEQATVDQIKAGIEQVKASTAQVYVDMQALDPSEVRKALSKSEEYEIQDIIGEDDIEFPEDAFNGQPEDGQGSGSGQPENQPEKQEEKKPDEVTEKSKEEEQPQQKAPEKSEKVMDEEDDIEKGVGVLVVKDGLVMVGKRTDNGQICGAGGHMKVGESPEESAVRETVEEFGIIPKELIEITDGQYLCTEFEGNPQVDGKEMTDLKWMSPEELNESDVFEPMKEVLSELYKELFTINEKDDTMNSGGGNVDGGPGSGRRPEGGHKEKEKKGRTRKTPKVSKKVGKLIKAGKIDLSKSDKGIAEDRLKEGKTLFEKSIGSNQEHASATIGNRTFEKFPELQEKYDQVVANEEAITKDMLSLSGETGAEMYGLPYSLKGADSMERKIGDKMDKKGMSADEAFNSIGDAVRYTQICPVDKLATVTNSTIDGLTAKGYDITEVDNKYGNEGYKGIHVNGVSPNGQSFEMQIHSPESMQAKEAGHGPYEVERDKETPPEIKERMANVAKEIYKDVPVPSDIDTVKSFSR